MVCGNGIFVIQIYEAAGIPVTTDVVTDMLKEIIPGKVCAAGNTNSQQRMEFLALLKAEWDEVMFVRCYTIS